MSTLHVSVDGQSWSFEEPRVVSIGRDLSCDIVLTTPTASRRHAELRSEGSGWVLVDIGSSSGTWLNGARVTEVRLHGRTSIRIGSTDGEELVLTPAGAAQRPAAAVDVAAIPPGLAQTIVPGTGPLGPGYVSGPGVLVRAGGAASRFPAGSVVRIGRDPSNEVVIDDPSASRLHGVIEGRPDGWWYVDRSTAGTYLAQDRVAQRKIEDPTTLMLGHPTAGVEVEVVPIVAAGQAQKSIARTAKKKRRRSLALVGGVAAAVVLAGGGVTAALLLSGDSDADKDTGSGTGLSAANLKRAKLATVQVIVVDEDGQRLGHGSGAIVSDDGLVVTNAHVADPNAPGQGSEGPDPAGLVIALPTGDDDQPAKPTYRAELLVSDGVLDVAVLQIAADLDGKEIDTDDLELPEAFPIGDSDELETDEEIRALGFPALARFGVENDEEDDTLTVTRGVVSTFIRERGIDDPRGWIDTDARIAGGNSGGPSINNDGELIGLNTQALGDNIMGAAGATSGGSGRVRPVKLLADVLEIARKGGDVDYVSPYYTAPPEPEETDGSASVGAAEWTLDGNSDCSARNGDNALQSLVVVPPTTLYAHYAVTGLPDGTPFELRIQGLDGTPVDSLSGTWSLGSGQVCASVTVDAPAGATGLNAVFVVGDVEVDNAVQFE